MLIPRYPLAVQGWSLDDEQLTLRLVFQSDHPASLRDPIRVGVHLSNSEVGLSSVSLNAYLFRLVCANGLVVQVAGLGGFHRRHTGRVGEHLSEALGGGIARVLEEEAAGRFIELRHKPVSQPMEGYIQHLAEELSPPDWTPAEVLRQLEGETLYDVINAFTQLAQRFRLQSGSVWKRP